MPLFASDLDMAMTQTPDLSKSALVVAHPDDEVLWFSSILQNVGSIIMCLEACDEYPALELGRQAVLHAYPLPQVSSLRVSEPCSVHLVDWERPEYSDAGLSLNAKHVTTSQEARYRATYEQLRTLLATRLAGAQTVFTHNPWGEYGHADHVQLARVVASLQPSLGFRLFYSGYVAPRTMPLAARELARVSGWFSAPPSDQLAKQIQALYRDHGCWTWPTDYEHFALETFLEFDGESLPPGAGFMLNCVCP
jgi:LmbE family N-acetylglucosaminyl deacetylase